MSGPPGHSVSEMLDKAGSLQKYIATTRFQRRHDDRLYLHGPHPRKTMVLNYGLHPLRPMVLKSPSATTSMFFSIARCRGGDFQDHGSEGVQTMVQDHGFEGEDHSGTGDHAFSEGCASKLLRLFWPDAIFVIASIQLHCDCCEKV